MKQFAIALFIIALPMTSSYADEVQPRTVSIYKRHMQSTEHDQGNFDHLMHHMLYLSGAADAYTVLNNRRVAAGQPRFYCQPDEITLNGNDYIRILEQQLFRPDSPLPDHLTVAEALLLSLQEEFPCQ